MATSIRTAPIAKAQEQYTALKTAGTQLGQPFTLVSPVVEGSTSGYKHNSEWFDAYGYHSDHLGSSSYITDMDRNIPSWRERNVIKLRGYLFDYQ